ncbi:Putative HTH-type transcriptional regulator [bacterium HR16]|nr:Putative HTH-type transcriptional regulator [bacterium HR16]
MTAPLCRVELFGGLRVVTPKQTITRFRTRKTASLLAYLAVNLHQTHPRETLIDLLWEDGDIDTGRTSLRVALSALRKQFQQADVPPDEVFYSDNFGIGLRSNAVTTDLHDMEQNIRLAHHTLEPSERALYLRRAADCCVGIPLPGFYDEWVLQLQQQTMERYFRALDELIQLLENEGDRDSAQEYALRGTALDRLREEPRMALMRLYLARGYSTEARRVYQEWESLVREELDAAPSHAMQQTAQQAEYAAQQARHSAQKLCESRLPTTPARLFGRERETAHVTELLRASTTRLITITGEGGIGKTALAIEVARRLVGKGQRAWFVDVSDVREGDALLEHILHTVGAAQYAEQPMDTAIQTLGGYPSLLVLDNFEQVDATGAKVVSELLQQLLLLQILVTSRRKIGLSEEQVLRLRPLEVPTFRAWQDESGGLSAKGTLETLEQYPSVQLFVQHAQTVRAEFQLTPENASAVAEICGCLDGVPLALILAASRARVLSPSQILRAIQQEIGVLSLPHTSHSERHRSLHASLEWSYALLSPDLRKAFAMLSVFVGGWDVSSATCMLTGQLESDNDVPDVTVLDTLDALIECSLVQMDEQDGQARYRMLEVVRRFALEKLQEGPYASDAFARHFLYYSRLATHAYANRVGPQATQWSLWVDREHQNMMEAIRYAWRRDTSRNDPAVLRMAANLWVFWMMRSILVEGRNVLDGLVADYREADDRETSYWWAWVAMGAGALAWVQRDLPVAEEMLHESLHRFEQEDDQEGQAFATIWLGNVFYRMSRYEQAEATHARGLVLAEKAQSAEARTYAMMWMGNLAQRAGDLERARALYQSCFHIAEESGDQYAMGFVHYNLGQVAFREGNNMECVRQIFRCLQIRARIEDHHGFLEAAETLTVLLARTGNDVAGAQMAGACETLRQRLYLPSSSSLLRETEDVLRLRMDKEVYQQQIKRGRSLSTQEVLALAESLI